MTLPPGEATSFARPVLPADLDDSRARERREDPAGWAFSADERAAVWRAIRERRDIRRFRPDPLPPGLLRRLLEAAHAAPSVGYMQPWRFVVVQEEATKAAMQALAARERLVQGAHFDERARHFMELKIEGIRESPVQLMVCCDRDSGGAEVLGRHTIRDTDLYSTSCAIENLWLAARAEGVGVGWVSFYRPEDVAELFALPASVVPVAYLCLGYPDERPTRPGLEAAGWRRRAPLDPVVFAERYGVAWDADAPAAPADEPAVLAAAEAPPVAPTLRVALPAWWVTLAAGVVPGDVEALQRVRDASDELVKPRGSLGGLETLVERWALATGGPPPAEPRLAVFVPAGDHGVTEQGVSLFPSRVSAQVAAAAGRGGTAIGVLAEALGAELVVADVGLRGPAAPGVLDRRVADGTADFTLAAAMDEDQLRRALELGHELGGELGSRHDALLVGEIGIGNTTAAAALMAALTGRAAAEVCGRGTGLDQRGVARKRAAVEAALRLHEPDPTDPLECLRCLGGLELAALVGALLGAAAHRCPVLLDGFATGVCALVACRLEPAVRDYLIAGHLSAEPAHEHVLVELGLEPLLDLRLRLGEASGAALAAPLIGLAGALHARMERFEQAGIDRPPAEAGRQPRSGSAGSDPGSGLAGTETRRGVVE